MGSFLQVIGSIASIVGIPLAESEGSSLLLTLINFEQGSTVDLTPFLS